MPYEAIVNPMLESIDYQASQPFVQWQKPKLEELIDDRLQQNPPGLELATLAWTELKHRKRQQRAVKLFIKHGLPPIGWLEVSRTQALAEFPATEDRRRVGKVYVILRDGYSEQNGTYGAYVGSTTKKVEQRFMEHRTGIRSARGLKDHGIELLYSLFAWGNPVKGKKEHLLQSETRLHNTLEEAIPKATGDVVDLPVETTA